MLVELVVILLIELVVENVLEDNAWKKAVNIGIKLLAVEFWLSKEIDWPIISISSDSTSIDDLEVLLWESIWLLISEFRFINSINFKIFLLINFKINNYKIF